ncbi:phosphonate metabolism protein/1,5-bisphosphokinase (PRPP-forming) PhnN [Neotabrizicola shimadae]|uniref:Ribose 1,5-bisphosphate phosphokinase PhnN n=1 Tax=Neotabrizicola shimadae TaxID=2807096 RepID=A0A8G0ZRH6_9RHOB|nr:phosphonate metabolism protein/1,5-bisphosphokinase (PRPP-forming) PhnN [Neotabrizicola shimadae]QYZ69109.1 phosphonate metabolism protein/1,5-bisphosphokinase (PRPP-forming) PhnN [Neotabrizicola shimadae]
MTGRVFAVVGPSGAGKDTLIAGAVAADPCLYWARRVVTRKPVPGDEPSEAARAADFAVRQAAGEFALSWQAHGLDYGIPEAEFAGMALGRDVIFNGSRAALPQALARFPGLAVLMVTAPEPVLAARIAARGREAAEDRRARLARQVPDLPAGPRIWRIVNDTSREVGIARFLAALAEARAL